MDGFTGTAFPGAGSEQSTSYQMVSQYDNAMYVERKLCVQFYAYKIIRKKSENS